MLPTKDVYTVIFPAWAQALSNFYQLNLKTEIYLIPLENLSLPPNTLENICTESLTLKSNKYY